MPTGVRGRSSNNEKIKKELNWEVNYSLSDGLKITYSWIEDTLKKNSKSVYSQ